MLASLASEVHLPSEGEAQCARPSAATRQVSGVAANDLPASAASVPTARPSNNLPTPAPF